jgi:hypothetical protein
MSAPPPAPVDAYHATDFIVVHDGREIAALLGHPSEEIDRLLDAFGAASGIFITAWNPFSQRCDAAANAAANEHMAARFADLGVRTLHHIGRAHDGTWCEEGFFALDLDPALALAIAAAFDQHAVVRIRRGGRAELLLTSG